MSELMKGLWPFLMAELIVLLLLVLFPALVMVPLQVADCTISFNHEQGDLHDARPSTTCAARRRWPSPPALLPPAPRTPSSRSATSASPTA